MNEAEEEAADIAAYDEAKAALAASAESVLPAEICKLILNGDSRLKAVRRWRGAPQNDVAAQAGIGQGYLSDLELGKRTGAPDRLAKIANVLDVPEHWIM